MFRRLATLLLVTTVLAGCGVSPASLKAPVSAKQVQAKDTPGWGKKTWATMTVPKEVMGYVS